MDIGWKRLIHPTTGALAAFAFHFLLFQLTESLVNDRAAELLGAEAVNPVYAAGLFCTASGYLLFAVLSRRIGSVTLRRRILASMGAGYLLSALWMATTMQPLGFVVCALAGLLSAGYIGGMSHWVLASALRGGKYTGRPASAAIAAGIGIQYLVQNFLPTPAAWLVWLAAAVFTVVFQYRCPDGGSFSGGPPSRCGTEPRLRRRLFVLSAAVVLMSLIISLDDTVCLTLHAQGSVNLFALPRVFYAGSVLLAGCLADRKDRAYLPLATVCVLLISGFTFAFLNRPDTYWVNVCLLYTYSGFYVAFFTIMFLDAAPKSSCPELWAGMGRIARSYTLAIATVPFIHLFDAFGSLPMMVLSTFFSAGCLLLFFVFGMLSPVRTEETPSSDAGSLEEFAQKHHLSPREAEVLAAIVDNDRSIRELAEELHISERTTYRHLTSIYEKTGASSRLGLSLIYYGKYKNEGVGRQTGEKRPPE